MELIDIEKLYEKFEECSSNEQVYRTWKQAELADDCLMFVVREEDNILLNRDINHILSNKLVCDYFSSNKVVFVNNKIINEIESKKGVSMIYIDYSLMFDSNICTYINAIMERKPFNGSEELIPLLLDILHRGVSYDFTFYLYENYKNINFDISSVSNSNELWDSLNCSFQKNIINLIKFKHIKPEDANSFRTNISDLDAEKEAIELCFKAYIQADDLLDNIMTKFKMIELMVLKIVEIQFSSNKSPQNKYLELTRFMNDKYFFSDRESIIALEYFKNKNLENFKKLHFEMEAVKFYKQIENITWDLMAPRIMEDFIKGMSSHKEVFIPFFLSYDKNLRETIRAYPIEYLFLSGNENGRRVISIPKNNTHEYLYKNDCHKAIEEIFSRKDLRRDNMSNAQLNLDKYLTEGYEECKSKLKLR